VMLTALTATYLPMFRDSLSVPSSRVKCDVPEERIPHSRRGRNLKSRIRFLNENNTRGGQS
jgi:hypothetical protein